MSRFWVWLLTATAFVVVAACSAGRNSPAGFRLPSYGNVDRGKAAFIALDCHRCHQVANMDLPEPAARPIPAIVLGGNTTRQMTDGYLVTSIINPSNAFAPLPRNVMTAEGKSRMPEYAANISVQQLTDVVAFLQAQYHVRAAAREYPLY